MKKIIFFLLALASLHPVVPAGAALLAGIVFALSVGNPFLNFTKKWTPRLLMISVVGLGFGMNLVVVGTVGFRGIGYTGLTIALSMGVGLLLGRLFKVPKEASILISAGTAICGGSAIAAVSAAMKAKSEDISISLATVFLLNAAALFIFPAIGHWAGLSQEQFGLWSALAVHDTSSVVGTSIQYGARALEIGTTVKLARALWIAPLTMLIVMFYKKPGSQGKFTVPWFILGFVIAAAIYTYVPPMQPVGLELAMISRRLLVLTLFLIGANLTRKTLQSVGFRPLLQGLALWIVAASTSLGAIHSGWIHL